MLAATLATLALFTLSYIAVWLNALRTASPRTPSLASLITGFVTNFFDTLGIGSFATTTSIFKFTRMVPDQLIPGTLNAGHTIPTIFQAFIYIAAIEVDPTTLLLMIAGAVAGSRKPVSHTSFRMKRSGAFRLTSRNAGFSSKRSAETQQLPAPPKHPATSIGPKCPPPGI